MTLNAVQHYMTTDLKKLGLISLFQSEFTTWTNYLYLHQANPLIKEIMVQTDGLDNDQSRIFSFNIRNFRNFRFARNPIQQRYTQISYNSFSFNSYSNSLKTDLSYGQFPLIGYFVKTVCNSPINEGR